ncbi:hypothetical protein ACLOJK_013312 [Asimina triloba]
MEEASAEGERDQECTDLDVVKIADSIKKRLPAASASGDEPCTIFRVPNVLRQVDENWYEPQVISIGPYHHGKERLKPREGQKLKHLQSILGRNPSVRLEDYVKKMKGSEEQARKCYSESISMNRHEFVEMLLLDGCFLVETFLQCGTSWRPAGCIPGLCRGSWFSYFMAYDMLLLENQLPFFILECIFGIVAEPSGDINSMAAIAINYLRRNKIIGFNADASRKNKYHHLLDLFHHHCLPIRKPPKMNGDGSSAGDCLLGLVGKLSCFSCVHPASNGLRELQVPSTIPSAEELQAAGVKFKRQDDDQPPGCSITDIEFQKNTGVIKIPYVFFTEDVICALKNLIALEQCSHPNDVTFFTAYAFFMDDIINTPKDVQILRRSGILEHGWGSDEEFSLLFNKMDRGVMMDEGHLGHLYKDLNDYCGTKWHIWRANLLQNYFNTPWAVLSFAGAILLLLLTVLQTFFAAFPKYSVK